MSKIRLMSLNFSPTFNGSLLHSNLSSSNSDHLSKMHCFITRPGFLIYTTFITTHILILLPLCIFVLYLGVQRWWQERSTPPASTSHSDTFTYHMVIMELFTVSGYILSCCGIYKAAATTVMVGIHLCNLTYYGGVFFHILTCVERYLAVIHPITYLSLRGERGISIRNISIGCVWLISFAAACLLTLEKVPIATDFSILIFSLIIISFCCLSVLCVLIRPGPGEQGQGRERVDQSKKKAFYTIMAILGVLLLRFFCDLVSLTFEAVSGGIECVVTISDFWFSVPSSLVLPLLYLYRAGKLPCCKNNSK